MKWFDIYGRLSSLRPHPTEKLNQGLQPGGRRTFLHLSICWLWQNHVAQRMGRPLRNGAVAPLAEPGSYIRIFRIVRARESGLF
ncbi:MAG: hypothetical protein KBE23_03535 [Chloroflexi bacterium]|nr:hypothetical protein [Chloroflexota bacterium]MBP7041785.1 hypothetical protein [Chloroflexota bacterium]